MATLKFCQLYQNFNLCHHKNAVSSLEFRQIIQDLVNFIQVTYSGDVNLGRFNLHGKGYNIVYSHPGENADLFAPLDILGKMLIYLLHSTSWGKC